MTENGSKWDRHWESMPQLPMFPAFGIASLKGGRISGDGLSEPLLCICGNELLVTSKWKITKCLK